MLTRKRRDHNLKQAKSHLKNHGWTYRNAAPVLGVTYVHVSLVLNAHRQSERLVKNILALPDRQQFLADQLAQQEGATL